MPCWNVHCFAPVVALTELKPHQSKTEKMFLITVSEKVWKLIFLSKDLSGCSLIALSIKKLCTRWVPGSTCLKEHLMAQSSIRMVMYVLETGKRGFFLSLSLNCGKVTLFEESVSIPCNMLVPCNNPSNSFIKGKLYQTTFVLWWQCDRVSE